MSLEKEKICEVEEKCEDTGKVRMNQRALEYGRAIS